MDDSTQQPISDDQDLAKALAGISQDVDNLTTEAIGAADDATIPPVATDNAVVPAVDATAYVADPAVATPQAQSAGTDTPVDPTLAGVKEAAISELRPLVDKLNVTPEEKFDTYLLLIRSTDDKTLIAPAHEAAKNIADEARRAQALLDIIKEIDFLSNPTPTQ